MTTVEHTDDYKQFNQWHWTEGNFGCDCNRGLFFYRAMGLEEPENEHACGHIRYSIHISDDDTGEILYREYKSDMMVATKHTTLLRRVWIRLRHLCRNYKTT